MLAASLEEFAIDPVGRYVAGETFAHFCADVELWGVLLWGRPTEADARQLGLSLVVGLSAAPHAAIVDATRLEGGDEAAFGALERYVARHGERLQASLLKLAIVRPRGLRGAMVAGAHEVVLRSYPVAIFDDLQKALGWIDPALGEDALRARAEALAALYAIVASTPPLLRALRVFLDAHLEGISVGEASSTLGVSDRTLQRKLGDAGTTFQHEMADARVRAAQRLLIDSDAALTTIALETGCASLQHFNALFRKRTGESPSAWRKRRRNEGA